MNYFNSFVLRCCFAFYVLLYWRVGCLFRLFVFVVGLGLYALWVFTCLYFVILYDCLVL